MDSESNPYAVSATWDQMEAEQIPRAAEKPKTWFDLLLMVLILGTCVIGSGVSTFEIETIIASGIILSSLGLLLVVREFFARRKRTHWPTGMVFGLFGPVFSIAIFTLIFVNEWSPQQATKKGVPTLCIVFAVAMCAFAILVFRELRTVHLIDHDSSSYEIDTLPDYSSSPDS